MPRPTLSVCIPNYNYGRFLRATLLSVLEQSCPPDEVWVLDDCSTDNSCAVVEELARQHPQLRLVRNAENLGAAANIIKALSLARCELLYCLGSDDLVAPGFFEASVRLLEQHPEAMLCCANAQLIDGADRPLAPYNLDLAETGAYLSPQELLRVYRRTPRLIAGSQAVFRREALLCSDVLRTDIGQFIDTLYVHGLAFRSGVCFQPDAPALIRVHGQGFSTQARANAKRTRAECLALLRVLDLPEHRAARDGFAYTGMLGALPPPILQAILAHRGGTRYLSRWFLRRWLRTWLAELSYPLRRALTWRRRRS